MNTMLTVSEAFEEFRSRLELSKTLQDAVTTHHNAVRKWLERYDPRIKTHLIGSLQRQTRIQPRPDKDTFDIDILVVLDSFVRWVAPGEVGTTPAAALGTVKGIVTQNETYERMGPETDSPTIALEYAEGIKVELVPAYLDNIGHASDGTSTLPTGRGYWIPKDSRQWVVADYDHDADYISSENERSGGYLIPVIKMLKAAKRHLFPQMQSYHLEVLATSIVPYLVRHFEGQGQTVSFPLLVWGFFTMAGDDVLRASQVPLSKSPSADQYLTAIQRQELSQAFRTCAEHCKQVLGMNDADAIRGWGRLFGDSSPSPTTSLLAAALWAAQRPKPL